LPLRYVDSKAAIGRLAGNCVKPSSLHTPPLLTLGKSEPHTRAPRGTATQRTATGVNEHSLSLLRFFHTGSGTFHCVAAPRGTARCSSVSWRAAQRRSAMQCIWKIRAQKRQRRRLAAPCRIRCKRTFILFPYFPPV